MSPTAEASWYEHVGHAPHLEEPERFNLELAALTTRVRGLMCVHAASDARPIRARPATTRRRLPRRVRRSTPRRAWPSRTPAGAGPCAGRGREPVGYVVECRADPGEHARDKRERGGRHCREHEAPAIGTAHRKCRRT